MKVELLLILSSIYFCSSFTRLIGKCGMAPKYRPIECFKGSVLEEDLEELSKILKVFKNGGDDADFANLLGDMIDKKRFKEKSNSPLEDLEIRIGGCGMHPKYLPVECFEQNVLRRDKKALREAYNLYHEKKLNKFISIYQELIERKNTYFNS